MKIKKLLCIFSLILSLSMLPILKVEAEEDKVIEVTLPAEKITQDNYGANFGLELTFREVMAFQAITDINDNEDIFYNPITNHPLFQINYDEDGFYAVPFTDTPEKEFTFSIPDEWYDDFGSNSTILKKVLEGHNIKIIFDTIPSDPIAEIVLDFSKTKDMFDLPYVITTHLEFSDENFPIIILPPSEENVVKFINRESQKILAIINGDDYSITIPDDVSYEDNISFDVELNHLPQIKKLSYIFGKEPENDEGNIPTQDEDNINNIDTNPTTYNNEIVLLVLGGCLLCSIATITKSKRKVK